MKPFIDNDSLFYNKLKPASEKLNLFFVQYRDIFGLDDYQYLFLKAKEKMSASKNLTKNLNKIWGETKDHLYKIDVYGSLAFKENFVTGLILVNKNTCEAIKLTLSKFNVKEIDKITE